MRWSVETRVENARARTARSAVIVSTMISATPRRPEMFVIPPGKWGKGRKSRHEKWRVDEISRNSASSRDGKRGALLHLLPQTRVRPQPGGIRATQEGTSDCLPDRGDSHRDLEGQSPAPDPLRPGRGSAEGRSPRQPKQ